MIRCFFLKSALITEAVAFNAQDSCEKPSSFFFFFLSLQEAFVVLRLHLKAWRSNEVIDFVPRSQFDSYQAEHREDILFRGFVMLLFAGDLHAHNRLFELFFSPLTHFTIESSS